MSRKYCMCSIVSLVMLTGVVSVSLADLIGVVPGFPLLLYDSQGSTDYNADTDHLAIEASPIAIRFSPGSPPRFIDPTDSPPLETVSIHVEVDDAGVLIGGVAGDDLVIIGEVDEDEDGTIDYSGVLLTGEVTEFGYEDSGSSTDYFDFRFTLTGGSLAPLYSGADISVTVTSEGSDFVDFTVNFSGGAKGNIGPIPVLPPPCDLSVTVEGCVITPPPPGGDDCQGKVIEFTMLYTGEDCGASSHDQDPGKVSCEGDPAFESVVHIIATDKSNPDDHRAKVWFDGLVNLGETYVIAAAAAGDSKLKANTYVHVFDAADNPLQIIKFHTSCSQPLSLGDQFGSALVAGMITTEGGEATPDPPPDDCITEFELPSGDDCQGKVIELTMLYTGEDCGASSHDQDPRKVSCEGDPAFEPVVHIIATDKSNPDDHRAKIWFDGLVNLNETYVIAAASAGESKLKANTYIHVFDAADNPLQTVKFHTSCSQPLGLEDQFGSMVVVGMFTTEGGSSSPGVEVEYTYTITNNGSTALIDVTVIDDTFGEVPGSPIPSIGPGETVVLTLTALVTDTTTNTVTVTGEFAPGVTCEATASATVTAVEPPEQFCPGGGKPKVLTMRYTGEDCSATSHSQDASKVSCSGDPVFETPVHIRASDKSNPTDGGAKVWFEGTVELDSTFEIDATLAGDSKLKAETWVHIFDMSDNLLQTIKFHTSCSQPLFAGDRFGSLILESVVPE